MQPAGRAGPSSTSQPLIRPGAARGAAASRAWRRYLPGPRSSARPQLPRPRRPAPPGGHQRSTGSWRLHGVRRPLSNRRRGTTRAPPAAACLRCRLEPSPGTPASIPRSARRRPQLPPPGTPHCRPAVSNARTTEQLGIVVQHLFKVRDDQSRVTEYRANPPSSWSNKADRAMAASVRPAISRAASAVSEGTAACLMRNSSTADGGNFGAAPKPPSATSSERARDATAAGRSSGSSSGGGPETVTAAASWASPRLWASAWRFAPPLRAVPATLPGPPREPAGRRAAPASAGAGSRFRHGRQGLPG